MRIKALMSAMLCMCHIGLMVWYYSHSQDWVTVNKASASFYFFGVGFILIGMNMLISSTNIQFPIQREISTFHSVFILFLGTLYALHYSGIMVTTSKEKLIMICAGVLVVLIIILISAWKHGFFKKETYD